MNDRSHQRSGFTLVELLVVISIIAIIAGLVVPVLLQGRGEAWKVQCTNNLKQIGIFATSYADKKFQFPLAKGDDPPAHESLNLLLRSLQGKGLEAKLFKCPAGDAMFPTVEDEKIVLDETTLDYAWTKVRRKPTGKAKVLASDKYYMEQDTGDGEERQGHEGLLQVLMTDSSVQPWEVEDEELEDKFDEETGLPIGLGR